VVRTTIGEHVGAFRVIEILAEPRRHIGNARADRGAEGGIGNIGAENRDRAVLNLARARV
jgi:hypothetical protein